jgi:ubiquinone/menaquinone biosynthesis C-methylase UbiE
VSLVRGDMCDLSRFEANSFDIVYQPYSINFVPDAGRVFSEVTRVLRPEGFYRIGFHNPYTISVDERNWTGEGYLVKDFYVDGEDITDQFPDWDVESASGEVVKVSSPRQFRHTMSTIVNGLTENRFVILAMSESTDSEDEADPEPGSWNHYLQVTMPYLRIWAILRPDAFAGVRRRE